MDKYKIKSLGKEIEIYGEGCGNTLFMMGIEKDELDKLDNRVDYFGKKMLIVKNYKVIGETCFKSGKRIDDSYS